MAISFSPVDTLIGWKEALSKPLGIIMLVGVGIYIFLRVTGKIDGISLRKGKSGKTSNQKADYILK